MANEVAKRNGTAMTRPGNTIPGLEGVEQDMLIIPRLKLVQKMSVEADPPYEIKPGSIVNSVTKDVLAALTKDGASLVLIPLLNKKSRLFFKPMSEGGGLLCQSQDGFTGIGDPGGSCAECPMNQWNDDEPPKCTELYNIFCLVRGYDYPIPLTASFGKTSFKAGKALINYFFNDSMKAQKSPWNFAYELLTRSVTNDYGTFFIFDVKPGGKATDEEIATGTIMYNLLSTTKVQIHEDEDEMKEEAAKMDGANQEKPPAKKKETKATPKAEAKDEDETPF